MSRPQAKGESLAKKFTEIVEASKQDENLEPGVRTRYRNRYKNFKFSVF
jgi:hypothetical protein